MKRNKTQFNFEYCYTRISLELEQESDHLWTRVVHGQMESGQGLMRGGVRFDFGQEIDGN